MTKTITSPSGKILHLVATRQTTMESDTTIKAIKISRQSDNINAFLDAIAESEGTYGKGDNGYNVLVGGSLFESYADHPARKIYIRSLNIKSSAAGRYQIMSDNWYGKHGHPETGLKMQLKLSDFSPESQEKAARALLKRRHAYDLIKEGKIRTALATTALKFEWASLPGAGYGQHENGLDTILSYYKQHGGILTD